MAKATCYQPVIAALFHEAKRRRLPMTRLVDGLLRDCLQGTPGWETASRDWPELNSTLPRSNGLGEIDSNPTNPPRNHGTHPHQ